MKIIQLPLILLLIASFSQLKAQLVVNNTTLTPAQLVQNVLLGSGVTVSNITFNGSAAAANQIQESAGQFNGTNSNIGLSNGFILGSGDVQVSIGPNNNGGASMGGTGNSGLDPDLAAITPNNIYDEAILEFDFIPQGDSISFKYVFASEEYDEYVCGTVNDAFGFFISGPGFAGPYTNGADNIALIPGTSTPVSINTVNLGIPGSTTGGNSINCDNIDPNWASYNIYYTQNTQNSVQYDGRTVVLTAFASVQCGEQYHIKIAIGDAGDGGWDSGVFLEAESFSSNQITIATESLNGQSDSLVVESCANASIIFNFIRPIDTLEQVYYLSYTGSATYGSDYSASPDSIILPIGVDTFQLVIDIIEDDATTGIESPENLIVVTSFTNQCGFTVTLETEIWIVEPELSVVANDVNLICPQTTIVIDAIPIGGSPGYLYDWDTGETTSGISVPGNVNGSYIVIVTDSCGLTATDTFDITVNQPPIPIINIVQDSVFQCFGSLSNLTSVVTGGATPIIYDWSTGGTTANINYSAPSDGYIYLTATDNCGEISNTDSVFIDVSVPLNLSVQNYSVTCSGDSTTLEVIASNGTPPYSYSWNTGGTDSIETVTTISTTTYSVTVVDGCQTLAENITVTVPVYDPLVSVMTGDTLICLGSSTSISTTTTGGAGQYTYSWDNNSNGSISYLPNGTGNFSPETPGYISVTVSDFCGTSTTDSLFINLEFCSITVPNVFSPNGDGINDLFVITNIERLPNSRLIIFNRWGKIVYESDNYQNNWNGDDLSEGTYYYIVKPSDPEQPEVNGYLSILREKN